MGVRVCVRACLGGCVCVCGGGLFLTDQLKSDNLFFVMLPAYCKLHKMIESMHAFYCRFGVYFTQVMW